LKATAAALAVLCVATAAQAQTKWRLAGNFATEHSSSVAMNQFRDEIAKASGGQFTVDVFPAMQLGGAAENVQNVRAGTLQMIWVGMAFLSRTVPELEAISLPFQFESREQAFRVVDGPVGKLLDAKFADKGLTDLGFMELGGRHVTNSKRPIKSIEDLKGLKIRMQPNETHLATFRALGANPVAMDIKELYSALQQGVVDGQENPFSVILSNKFYEVQKFLSTTNHTYSTNIILVSKKFWDRPSPAEQTILQDAAIEARDYQRKVSREQAAQAVAELKGKGMQVNEIAGPELDRMRDRTKPIAQRFAAEYDKATVDLFNAELERIHGKKN
jgi:tripartite ATP-independent transporter DctP family solute receptor